PLIRSLRGEKRPGLDQTRVTLSALVQSQVTSRWARRGFPRSPFPPCWRGALNPTTNTEETGMGSQATSLLDRPQSDLSLVPDPVAWPAQQLLPAQRQELALQVLAGTHPVAELARQHQVSRKFLYQQADAAQHALSDAFEPEPSDREVLFY